jgi:hypothetical protein
VTVGMYLPLYGAPIWPLATLLCLCGWLVSLAALKTHRLRRSAEAPTAPWYFDNELPIAG